MRLGVDYGSRRIGIAIADELGARPLEVIDKTKRDPIARIAELVRDYEVKTVFVGLPFRLSGRRGPEVDRAQAFVDALAVAIPGTPIETRDEALTTYEAQRRMIDAGLSPSERKAKVDAWAAAVMLEEALAAGLDARR
ncbi:MAG: Holliday junction resolvase RuvX [Deltaproteobacteria bacterium]|nr:Holliday junction resolvase RuvX [Deltaproteobacteria bacterium]